MATVPIAATPAEPAPPAPDPPSTLQTAALIHVGALAVFTTWAFGGQIHWARNVILLWGCGAPLLTVLAARAGANRSGGARLSWLWPLALFNALVLVSCCNRLFQPALVAGEEALVRAASITWLPGTADPALSLRKLGLLDVLYLSAFNLAFIVRRRRALRALLAVLAANALALAIFGSLQKLARAPGLYFGLMPSPNSYFFSSFIYPNHWGAFIVLATATGIGLLFHYARRLRGRGFWHSPVFMGLVAVMLMAATAPLSRSRSATLMVFLLLFAALFFWLARILRSRRTHRESALRPALATLGIAVAACAAVWWLSARTIELRADATREQLEQMSAQGNFGNRQFLYRDTLRMGLAQPVFGWGWGNYGLVFPIFESGDLDGEAYLEAHSDWIQAFAETGATGLLLLMLTGAVPLAALPWRRLTPLPAWLLAGCGLIAAYAWLEFPFANPAVALFFWICLFSAVQYTLLTRPRPASLRQP